MTQDLDSDDEKVKSQMVAWDCGAGALRLADIDTRYRPEPHLITNLMDERHFLAITCMRIPPAFHRSTLFNTPAHIVMDAFRCHPTESSCLFSAKLKDGGYLIPWERRLMQNNPDEFDYEKFGVKKGEDMVYKQSEVMASIIQEVTKALNARNIHQIGAYLCVPDAAPLKYLQNLRKAFIEVSNKRFGKAKFQDIQECPKHLSQENPLTKKNIFYIQRTAAAAQMYFHRRGGAKVYDHNREQFHRDSNRVEPRDRQIILPRTVVVIAFGAGHFSSAIYKQEAFERYGIRQLFNVSDAKLGGEDLCYRLCEYIVDQLSEKQRKEMLGSPRLLKFLRNAMNQAKIDLSGFSPAVVDIELSDEEMETFTISKELFETKIAHKEFETIETYIQQLKNFSTDHNLDITDILLVRGSTRTQRVIDLVGTYFPKVPIVKCLNTDECTVMGTALKGAIRGNVHRIGFAEVEDVAIRDEVVEIDGIRMFLTKKFESVQNSRKYTIRGIGNYAFEYQGQMVKSLSWKREVSGDPQTMIVSKK